MARLYPRQNQCDFTGQVIQGQRSHHLPHLDSYPVAEAFGQDGARVIEKKLKQQVRRYNKYYLGEMVHVDTKRLPLLQKPKVNGRRDYLFVAIEDSSREWYAAILLTVPQSVQPSFCWAM